MTKCCWKKDANRLAQGRVALNLQFVKNARAVKPPRCNKNACIFSPVQLYGPMGCIAHKALLSMEFSRQQY